jgi:peptidylprolyl isomerase
MFRALILSAVLAVSACSAPPAAQDEPWDSVTPWTKTEGKAVALPSGLEYVVVKTGPEDGASPAVLDEVRVHYEGRLVDGTVFDSSYARGEPAVFPAGRLIAGWVEALGLMKPGDEWMLYIPYALAYGETGTPDGTIPPASDLVFRVALLDVIKAPEPFVVDEQAWAAHTPWNAEAPGVVKSDTGLQYIVLAEGPADGPIIQATDWVKVQYEGRLADTGETIDSTAGRPNAAMFPANAVILGWQESLSTMRAGDRRLIYLPADIAYGDTGTPDGTVPPNSDLMFEISVLEILP